EHQLVTARRGGVRRGEDNGVAKLGEDTPAHGGFGWIEVDLGQRDQDGGHGLQLEPMRARPTGFEMCGICLTAASLGPAWGRRTCEDSRERWRPGAVRSATARWRRSGRAR